MIPFRIDTDHRISSITSHNIRLWKTCTKAGKPAKYSMSGLTWTAVSRTSRHGASRQL